MRLKATIGKIDFVPMIKKPRMWISPTCLVNGSILDIEPEMGYQLLATYPGCFKILAEDEVSPVKRRNKKIEESDIVHGATASDFTIAEA